MSFFRPPPRPPRPPRPQQQQRALPQAAAAPLPRQVSGPLDRVPCPHCGTKNDLRELHSEQLLDTANIIDCNNCRRLFFVTNIVPVLHIVVRVATAADMGQGVTRSRSAAPVAPARTLSPAQAQRLLRGR